ncbi:hypothetical protein [Parafrankia sp. FMc2]|uniref:hypothetical protein n=1 Tax=Parafrankia sp. FMc2 TaxID=3233196 RepID=UPI0034D61843
MSTTVAGYPRTGPARELETLTGAYRAGRLGAEELLWMARRMRAEIWRELADAGLDTVPSNTFSFHDQVLDVAVMCDAVPDRFRAVARSFDPLAGPLDVYFAMARGAAGVAPLETTTCSDPNYHHLVPELGPSTRLMLVDDKPLREFREAAALGVVTRPVLVGPLTFLLLAKASAGAPDGFRPLDLLDGLVECYAELLGRLAAAGADWVQLDEPALTGDLGQEELVALGRAYRWLGTLPARPRLLVSTCFGEVGEALPVLRDAPVDGVGLDFVGGPGNTAALARVGGLGDRTLFAGVVNGHDGRRADLPGALSTCASLLGLVGDLVVTTCCSPLHVQLDHEGETSLDPPPVDRMAFARQKIDEVVLLGRALRDGRENVAAEIDAAETRRLAVPG